MSEEEHGQQEDLYATMRAQMDQVATYHDEMMAWLGARTAMLRVHCIPEPVQSLVLGRLVDLIFPVSSPLEDAMRMMVDQMQQELEERTEGDTDE